LRLPACHRLAAEAVHREQVPFDRVGDEDARIGAVHEHHEAARLRPGELGRRSEPAWEPERLERTHPLHVDEANERRAHVPDGEVRAVGREGGHGDGLSADGGAPGRNRCDRERVELDELACSRSPGHPEKILAEDVFLERRRSAIGLVRAAGKEEDEDRCESEQLSPDHVVSIYAFSRVRVPTEAQGQAAIGGGAGQAEGRRIKEGKNGGFRWT
jgi:hypothetical protein